MEVVYPKVILDLSFSQDPGAGRVYVDKESADDAIAALEEECVLLRMTLEMLKTPAQPSLVAQARIIRLEDALLRIAQGSWNFGNDEPGLQVGEFARRALEPAAE